MIPEDKNKCFVSHRRKKEKKIKILFIFTWIIFSY